MCETVGYYSPTLELVVNSQTVPTVGFPLWEILLLAAGAEPLDQTEHRAGNWHYGPNKWPVFRYQNKLLASALIRSMNFGFIFAFNVFAKI